MALMFVGCMSHTHVIGKGSQENTRIFERQWYVLFGLVPINNVDTKLMAGDAANYTIITKQSFIDSVIGVFTGLVSVYPRSVVVIK
jgi:hypothetical protein